MPDNKVSIPLSGLKFLTKNTDAERMVNASLAKQGAVTSTWAHTISFATQGIVTHIMTHKPHNAVYTVDADGVFGKSGAVIDTGYYGTSQLLASVPNDLNSTQQIFIAGGNKMRKYDGTTLTTWGLTAPTGAALVAVPQIVGVLTLNDADTVGHWSSNGLVIVSADTGFKTQGASSVVFATSTTRAVNCLLNVFVNNPTNVNGFLFFEVAITDPSAILEFTLHMVYSKGGVNITASRSLPRPNGVLQFTTYSISEVDFLPPDATILQMNFYFSLSHDNVSIWIDNVRVQPAGQDDIVGAHYKYFYYNFNTTNSSNLIGTPTTQISGIKNLVTISGFAEPPAGQGITHIGLVRDVGGNGVYQLQSFIPVPVPWGAGPVVNDTTPVNQLGPVFIENNATPPFGNIMIEFLHSIWLNDVTNQRRVWRSVAGKKESFVDFFDVLNTTETLMGFLEIRTNLFILTSEAIIVVLNADAVPQFVKLIDLGTISQVAWCTFGDQAVIVGRTGVYIFDGANIHLMSGISSLFEDTSSDPRRINKDNINSCGVGSDDRRIWFRYVRLDNITVQFIYDSFTKQWTEDGQAFFTHDTVHSTASHLASGYSTNAVYSLYSSAIQNQVYWASPEIELDEISYIEDYQIEYQCEVTTPVSLFVDGILINTFSLIPQGRFQRRFAVKSDTSVIFGRRVSTLITTTSGGIQVYNQAVGVSQLVDRTYYDSGTVHVSFDINTFREINIALMGIENGVVTVNAWIGSVDPSNVYGETLVLSQNISLIYASSLVRRFVITPLGGHTCRIQILGSRFKILSLSFSAEPLAGGNPFRVNLPIQ